METKTTASPTLLSDASGRRIRYLRMSVTDRCDMRCAYCMPEEGVHFSARDDLLSYEEIERLVTVLTRLGVDSVRISGGEPLLRKDVVRLVERVAAVPGVEDVAMTTNARLLHRHSEALKRAGLSRLNISLDSLEPAVFAAMARGWYLPEVLRGIEAARSAGFSPLKLNCVVAREINQDDPPRLIEFCRERDITPRFIELMPMGGLEWFGEHRVVSSAEVREGLRAAGYRLELLEPGEATEAGPGPARYWRIRPGGDLAASWSTVGFISPLSEGFCDSCNRMRISCTGRVRACLGWDDGVSLRDLMRAGCSDEALEAAIRGSLAAKRAGHEFTATGEGKTGWTMSSVGG